MDRRVYWTTKSSEPEYEAITFEHSAFGAPIRLVANQFAPVTLGGHVHTPAPMQVRTPDQKSDAQPKLTMSFPRAVVGREFKQKLQLVAAAGAMEPIVVRYELYLSDTDVPEVTWLLYVADAAGVVFGADAVQVTATDDNPMRRPASLIYDPSVWTGLEMI